MLILRTFLTWAVVAGLVFTALRVLTSPILRPQVVNRRTIKNSTFFLIASVAAALVVGFLLTAEKLF